MAVSGTLKLQQTVRSATFRRVLAILRADPVLDRVVSSAHWRTWDGNAISKAPLPSGKAGLIVTPASGPAAFWSPSIQRSTLFLDVVLQVGSLDAEDILNLWGAIERAIYPADGPKAMANVAALQSAAGTGSSGMVLFSQPANIRQADHGADGQLHADAQMAIEVYTPS